jgi:hypothetical protein
MFEFLGRRYCLPETITTAKEGPICKPNGKTITYMVQAAHEDGCPKECNSNATTCGVCEKRAIIHEIDLPLDERTENGIKAAVLATGYHTLEVGCSPRKVLILEMWTRADGLFYRNGRAAMAKNRWASDN